VTLLIITSLRFKLEIYERQIFNEDTIYRAVSAGNAVYSLIDVLKQNVYSGKSDLEFWLVLMGGPL
ncbi:14430_t:CDS:1, partial [Funneliformis caledonium]